MRTTRARTSQPAKRGGARSARLSEGRRRARRTVRVDRHAVRRSNTEDGSNEDVLERRDQEESRVFERDDVEFVGINLGRDIPARHKFGQSCMNFQTKWMDEGNAPGTRANVEERKELNSARDDNLTDQRSEHLLGDEAGRWSFGMNARECLGATH